MNPAAVPTPLEDVQGDGRWLSMRVALYRSQQAGQLDGQSPEGRDASLARRVTLHRGQGGHNRFVNQAREMEPDVVFVGDSLLANLQNTELWEKWFAPMHCLNFGIGGDQTQHVLWRLRNGELECIKPKAVVVMVGTNNHEHSAEDIAGGITEICSTIREKQPESEILVLTLLPRGEKPNRLREKNSEVNSLIKESLRSFDLCQIVSVDQDLVLADGTIDHRDMYDYLHLTTQGYRRAFEPLYLLLCNLLQEDSALTNDASSTLPSPSDNPSNPGPSAD